MSKILKPLFCRPLVFNQAAMVIDDFDKDAERIFVIDRLTMVCMHNKQVPNSNIIKLIVPLHFSVSERLLVGILDDSKVYNAKVKDGIQAEVVDGNVVKMN